MRSSTRTRTYRGERRSASSWLLLPILALVGLNACASHVEHTVVDDARPQVETLLREALRDLESSLPAGTDGGVVQPLVEVLRPADDWFAHTSDSGNRQFVDLGLDGMEELLERELIAALDASPRRWEADGQAGDPVLIARLEVYYEDDPERAVYLVDCFYEGSSVRAAGQSSLLGIRPPYCAACGGRGLASDGGDGVDIEVGGFFWLGGFHHHHGSTYLKVFH